MEEENDGNFLIGFLLGFFLSCIGAIIGLVMPGSRTSTGAIIGFLVNLLGWLCMGIGVSVLQAVLMQSSSM
ncbi:MAG TPA: hypothetical protein ENK18_14095 [Deltaproteobacteria bacterium]|nr:hypothetical protein [Deltaproteobacteria bacterium]